MQKTFTQLKPTDLAGGVEIFDTDLPEECGDRFPEARYVQVPKGLSAEEVIQFILENHQPGLFSAVSEYTVGDWINCCSGKVHNEPALDHPVAVGLERLNYQGEFSMFVGGKGCTTSIATLRRIYLGQSEQN